MASPPAWVPAAGPTQGSSRHKLCDPAYIARFRSYLEELTKTVQRLSSAGWQKEAILGSDQLPPWRTADQPELLRANIERVYDELLLERGKSLG